MSKTAELKDSFDRDCVKNFQKNDDPAAFNSLIYSYYKEACKYASKFLNSQLYSTSITWSYEEVASYVFIAFLKAVKNYRWEDKSSLSFKNYLYQLIKFETIHEIKKLFAWKLAPKVEKEWYKTNEVNEDEDASIIKEIALKHRVSAIHNFLIPKGKDYALIWSLKAQGLKNEVICKKLGINEVKLKSRWQYIKKLILESFPSLDQIF